MTTTATKIEVGSAVAIARDVCSYDVRLAAIRLLHALESQTEWAAKNKFERADAIRNLRAVRDAADAMLKHGDKALYFYPGDILRITPHTYGQSSAGGKFTSRFGVVRGVAKKHVKIQLLRIVVDNNSPNGKAFAPAEMTTRNVPIGEIDECILDATTGEWRGSCDAPRAIATGTKWAVRD